MRATRAVGLAALAAGLASAQRVDFSVDYSWKFAPDAGALPQCKDPNSTFPVSYNNKQILGLSAVNVYTQEDCENACCAESTCDVWQFCPQGASGCQPASSCWIGPMGSVQDGPGWVSQGRNATPPAPPSNTCTDPRCQPSYDDSAWRGLDIPHDFVVEGNFSASADKSHGYLPYGVGWYRKHFQVPSTASPSDTFIVEFGAIATSSQVWLNGYFVASSASAYTAVRFFVNTSMLVFGGADNVLAVRADATNPDGWWYDGGGIPRSIKMTVIHTPPAVFIAPWGVYVPSNVTGPITWSAAGVPSADSALTPYVEVWSNSTSAQTVTVSVSVADASGTVVGTASGSVPVPAGGNVTWSPSSPILMPAATLWHIFDYDSPTKPALYYVTTTLSVGGVVVDNTTVRTGVRATYWSNATGFWLNGVNTKILSSANHQDFAAVGVAVPPHVQYYRVWKLKSTGGNGWRTAHNVPDEKLLDACDELGIVVWDENHRNGQFDQVPFLVRRDRNRPSVVIWSICNEVLCQVSNGDWVQTALGMKALMKELDPHMGRVVSANQNGWIGPNTPLDVQGFDYSTTSYDGWHAQAPNIPSISSETSSAVSDRGEYVNDEAAGHVSGYDNNYPGWGETAEGAWGGVGESNGQGILTRPFIAGGNTWTFFDYRGEPTPYAFPDVNSHFGIVDLCGFDKDRTYWYRSWFPSFNQPAPGVPPSPASTAITTHVFPTTWQPSNWAAGKGVDIWAFSNAEQVELFVNGASQGVKNMTRFSHVEWDAVPYAPGSIRAVSYVGGVQVGEDTVTTAGAPASLRASIRDGFNTPMYAGCQDVGLVMVEVLDASGNIVPDSSNNVTFSVTGPGTWTGGCNGDPAEQTNNKASTWPVFHGLALGVILGPSEPVGPSGATITVTVSSPGLTGSSVTIPVADPDETVSYGWCTRLPRV